MKYIIKFLLASIVFPFAWLYTFIICLWECRFFELKELVRDYKMIYARMMWNVFRINKYSVILIITISFLVSCSHSISVQQAANAKARCGKYLK